MTKITWQWPIKLQRVVTLEEAIVKAERRIHYFSRPTEEINRLNKEHTAAGGPYKSEPITEEERKRMLADYEAFLRVAERLNH